MVYSYLNLVQETAILVEVSEFAVYRYCTYLWRLLCHIARRCRLRDHTYQSQKVLRWKVNLQGDACRFACTYQPQRASELDE